LQKISRVNLPYKHPKWTSTISPALLISVIMLLFSCAQPARYVIISEDAQNVNRQNTSQRYICLTKEDASNNVDILELYTKSDIQKYAEIKRIGLNPIEDVLSSLIRGSYYEADNGLKKYEERIPLYLRLLLKADLSFEFKHIPKSQIVGMYQEAFEVQACPLNKEFIKFRIRQMRYGR
jgi:hypothetical protein